MAGHVSLKAFLLERIQILRSVFPKQDARTVRIGNDPNAFPVKKITWMYLIIDHNILKYFTELDCIF